MDIQQLVWTEEDGWQAMVEGEAATVVERPIDAQMVLYFAAPAALEKHNIYKELNHRYPFAHVVGLSTDGQVAGAQCEENTVSAVAVKFKKTELRLLKTDLSKMQQSYDTGKFLGRQLAAPDLKAVMLISDDLIPDAAALAATLSQEVGPKVKVFGMTSSAGFGVLQSVAGGDEKPAIGRVAALGFYGDSLVLRVGKMTGCAPYGAEHTITRSMGRELLELDGRPALEIYRKYLKKDSPNGEQYQQLFPFFIRQKEQPGRGSLRSVTAVNEETNSLILGGNVPEGRIAQLMYASHTDVALEKERKKITHDRLQPARPKGDRLCFLLSTSARKAAFGTLVHQERSIFHEAMDPDAVVAGGYGGGVYVPDDKGDLSRYDNFSATAVTLQET